MIMIALAVLAANLGNITSVFAAAKPGDTVRLVAGRYPILQLQSRTFNPPLTVDASAATMTGVWTRAVSGLKWTGGMIDGSNLTTKSTTDFGFTAYMANNVTVTGVKFNALRVGIVFDHVTGGEVSNNSFTAMRADGVDLAVSRQIAVTHNACASFNVDVGEHPDCIQAWSKQGEPPVADITVTGNSAIGTMQGISFFDSGTVGGFDRVTITGNHVTNTMGNGIAAYNCRSCTVKNNVVASLPDYLYVSQLVIAGGSVTQCGNDVAMVPWQATPPCKS